MRFLLLLTLLPLLHQTAAEGFCNYEAIPFTTICSDFLFDFSYPLVLSQPNMILHLRNATGGIDMRSLYHTTDTSTKQLVISYSTIRAIEFGALCLNPNLYSIEFDHNFVLPPISGGTFENCVNLSKLVFNENHGLEITDLATLHNLKHLYIENQNIRVANRFYFDGLWSLEVLSMKGCGIEAIEVGAFSDLKSLKSLLLDDNDISRITADTFTGLPNLAILYLYGNRFEYINGDEFIGLDNLERISLGDNPIRAMEVEIFFSRLPKLKTLGISYEYLSKENKQLIDEFLRSRNIFRIEK